MKLGMAIVTVLAAPFTSISAACDEWDELHSSVRNAGDVDGDGTNDIMIADRIPKPGVVWVLSGRTRELLLSLRPRYSLQGLPSAMDSLGDVNGDGRPDLVVSWRTWPWPSSWSGTEVDYSATGHAIVYCGLDGGVLYVFPNTWVAARAGDVDADGVPDVLLSASHLWRVRKSACVQIASGRDGSIVRELQSRAPLSRSAWDAVPMPGDLFGTSMAGVGDVDGDGHGDVAIGAPGTDWNRGAVELFSGRDGRRIANVLGQSMGLIPDNLGWSMASMSDVDQDGIRDLLVGAIHRYVVLCSGRDLRPIYSVHTRWSRGGLDAFASSIDRLGDVNGDGIEDWIAGANEAMPQMFDKGYARVFSGADGRLLRVDFENHGAGLDVCGLGDVNGDGVPDAVISCPKGRFVQLLCGADGGLLHDIDLRVLRRKTPNPK